MTFLDELGAALHWQPRRPVVMLWAYVDDSNIHNRASGKAETIGHGGGIAPLEKWQALENEWRMALDKEEVDVFHMTDFATTNKQFKGWTAERQTELLYALISIIRKHVVAFVC